MTTFDIKPVKGGYKVVAVCEQEDGSIFEHELGNWRSLEDFKFWSEVMIEQWPTD